MDVPDHPRLTFRILGPLEVLAGGAPLPPGGPRQRALLALLLLDANRVVSRDRLVEELFSGHEVHSAEGALRVQVSRLRRSLGHGGDQLLVRRPPGYVLTVAADALDLLELERLLARAGAEMDVGDHASAAVTLRDAESLWRGPPLADVELNGAARVGVERLAELRVSASEQRFEAELALGRHRQLISDLDALVAGHPTRERLRGQLMLALYRSGRQAEALEAYRAGRSWSAEHLGLEPGPELRHLQRAILRHDPGLGVAPRTHENPDRPAEPAAERPRRRILGIVAIAAAAVVLVAALLALHGQDHTAPGQAAAGNRLVLVATPRGRVLSSILLRAAATHVTAGLGSLWVTEAEADQVERIDTARRVSVQAIRVGDQPVGAAVADGDVWVANALDGTVSRIDASTNEVVQVISLGGQPGAVVAAGGSIWVANREGGTVTRIDPARGRVVATIRVGRGPACLAAAAGTLWVGNEDAGTVTRIDLRSGDVVDTVRVGEEPSSIAATPTRLWVVDRLDATVSALDPRSDAVLATYPVGGQPSGLAVTGSSVWVADDTTGRIARLDPVGGAPESSAVVGDHAGDAVMTPDGVWVISTPGGAQHRGGTLRLVETTFGSRASIDPAVQTFAPPLALQALTNDGLVTLDHIEGPEGTRLVPDLALSLPEPSDAGRTYTFRLRPGIRYSTGRTVRASDVRSSLERLFDPGVRSVGGGFFSSLVGAAACIRQPARPCDLARGVVTDDEAGTVTFHLTSPDPDFLFKLTLSFAYVLPKGTPDRISTAALPATGPYMVRSTTPAGEVVLVRNPRFREWSHAAQPSGYPDRIEWRVPTRTSGPLMAASGTVDLTPVIGSLGRDEQTLRTRHAGQLRSNWFAATEFWFLNANAKPFDDVRVRRAFNDAVDRNHVATAFWGGPAAAAPTCQLLPPLVPGFARYCPYTLRPSASGRWRAPDLAKARALVAASGTRGMRVTVWTLPPAGEAHYLATVLRQLGYRASVRVMPDDRLFAFTGDSRNHAQVVAGGWSADYPSASNFIGKLSCRFFTPGDSARTTDLSEHCDPAFDRQVEQAQALQSAEPQQAATAWARLDRLVTDRALLLPLVSFRETDVLAPHVGNYQYHPIWGPIVDQLWVR